MDLKRVVITGLGTINPLGHNVPEFWDNLLKGVSGAGPITRFDASKFRTQFACEVKNYEPTEYFDKKEVRKMDLYTQFGIIAAREALKDSGLDLETANKAPLNFTNFYKLFIHQKSCLYLKHSL